MNRSTSWETELWSYLDIEDKLFCPIFARCNLRKTGTLCSCPIFCIGSSAHGCCSRNCNTFDLTKCKNNPEILPCKNTNAAFIQTLKPGRLNELIELLSQKWLENFNIKQPPIPLSLINQFAPSTDVTVRVLALKACHGAVWKVGKSSWVIYINSKDDETERRFTLFHEAFHILAHHENKLNYRRNTQQIGAFSEYLADNFAYKLLMPKNWIREDWEKINDVKAIAHKYQVPLQAVYMRLRELDI